VKRTHLPLNGLRVFDAAARHLSFTRAADELAVTPAAVGQQIRALEDVLGVVLFRRTPKGLELTAEAEAGLLSVRAGFLQFEEAARAMQAGQSSSALTIAAPRDFASKWLAPRLAAYCLGQPDIVFTLVSVDESFDFTEANLDLAIIYAADPGDHEGVKIAEGALVTVAKPDVTEGAAIAWAGGPQPDTPVLRVPDAGLALEAAVNGLGYATVPHLLAESDIAAGRVRAVGDVKADGFAYWLIAPMPQWRQKKVKLLVEALCGPLAFQDGRG
jgi:LysR family transcriptional regulator, glycine cleavage system transcriptional activator